MNLCEAVREMMASEHVKAIRRQCWEEESYVCRPWIQNDHGLRYNFESVEQKFVPSAEDFQADDWETMKELPVRLYGLTISEAVVEAKKHNPPLRIRRSSWKNLYLVLEGKFHIKRLGDALQDNFYKPTQEDLEATDWEVLDHPPS